jgi:hypothetical protein
LRAIVAALALPLRQSRAVGVAKRCTAVASPSPLFGLHPLRLWFPLTVGVGQRRTATDSCIPALPAACAGVGFVLRLLPAWASGVGHKPEPFADVRGSDIVRSHNAPSRIKPQAGKVSEDSGKSSANKQW